MTRRLRALAALSALGLLLTPQSARAACCYFTAKDKDVSQPAQKAFVTWDPREKVESFTVQPKFEGNAQDFGMVVPTPGRPKLDEMPRDFFKELAVFTILKKREYPSRSASPGRRPGWRQGPLAAGVLAVVTRCTLTNPTCPLRVVEGRA